jgi:hypothetical protein
VNTDELNLNRRDLMVGASVAIAAAPLPASAQPAPAGTPVMTRVSLNVNGQARSLEVDTRTSLLDALRGTPASHRHQEGLRPRPVRRLHGDCGRTPDQFLPDARRHALEAHFGGTSAMRLLVLYVAFSVLPGAALPLSSPGGSEAQHVNSGMAFVPISAGTFVMGPMRAVGRLSRAKSRSTGLRSASRSLSVSTS